MTVPDLLKTYLTEGHLRPNHYRQFSVRIGLDRLHIEHILEGRSKPTRGTLLKIADGLRLDAGRREALERASSHYPQHKGFLEETKAKQYEESVISMRRAILLLTAPEDPSKLPYDAITHGKEWKTVVARSGIVFGPYDVVVRVTTPKGVSTLDYSQYLYQRNDLLRTVETIPLRDDMPIYIDKTFSGEHLGESDYIWATIFIEALGGQRSVEFPEIFYEVAEEERFWGGVHLLTAAITVGHFDSVVEILASNLDVLQHYVREAQSHAWTKYNREAHTITYIATHLSRRKRIAEF
jgi:transcriptional regulator with XRE-family HTH domain